MIPARFATTEDAAEVVRLAAVMYVSMGMPDPDDAWRAAAAEAFASRLGADIVGAVVDHPTARGRLVTSGVATVSTRLPSPPNPDGSTAYIQWVATDEEFRQHGFARAVMTMLLEWLDARDVAVVELHATPAGGPLYRSLGFGEGDGAPALRRRRWDLPPRRDPDA